MEKSSPIRMSLAEAGQCWQRGSGRRAHRHRMMMNRGRRGRGRRPARDGVGKDNCKRPKLDRGGPEEVVGGFYIASYVCMCPLLFGVQSSSVGCGVDGSISSATDRKESN